MEPYQHIVSDAHEPVTTLALERKTGGIPKGRYGFIECYCTMPGCDCRRVSVLVVNEKMRQKAVISFGFDQQGAFSGPYLESSQQHAPFAPALLQFFVQSLNSDSGLLERLYRHYVEVRERIEGEAYRGKPFPAPGALVYREMLPPGLEAEIEQSLRNLDPAAAGSPVPKPRRRGGQRKFSGGAQNGMAFFVRRYAEAGAAVCDLIALRSELRHYVLESDSAGEELASLLPELSRHSPEAGEQLGAALRLLYDMLKVMDIDMETDGTEARRRMERFQGALAQRIFLENEDLDLCAAVSTVLLQSRAEILPVLREATAGIMLAGASRTDLDNLPGEEIMSGLLRSLSSMGITSPFDGVRQMLQFFTLTEPAMQTAIIAEMLQAPQPLLRDISALMIFHREEEVRSGVSHVLAEVDGALITPETLRRLIVCRNWFPVELRGNLDRAISKARRARVECAPLSRPDSLTLYASATDAPGGQSFHAVVPEGRHFACCEISLMPGAGVTEASVVQLKSKREMERHLKRLQEDPVLAGASAEFLDDCLCNALADGIERGEVPAVGLLRIAELLGRDRWIAVRSP